MNNKGKDVRLYNALFPLWFILLFPPMWLIVLPGNFIIDSLVLIISMLILKVADKKQLYKKCILKIFGFGLLADAAGSAFMFLMVALGVGRMGDESYLTLPALILSSFLIFKLNYSITFKEIETKIRYKLSLIFAIVTAPYTFLVPSSWLYYH